MWINQSESKKTVYLNHLEDVYGPPSQEAFGTAVFQASKMQDLEKGALDAYQYFAGDLWDEWGEEAWMGPWKQVYKRGDDQEGDIIQELNDIDDFDAKMSIPMFLEGIDDPEKANQALQEAFNDPAVSELAVYNLGDGGAMSGILIAALRKEVDEATFLIFLYD